MSRGGQRQVWKVPPSGEEEDNVRQVTRRGGRAAIESPDGRHVYFTRQASGTVEAESSIWRIPVEGGDEEVVVESFRSSDLDWDVTAEGIYFLDRRPSPTGPQWVVRYQGFGQREAIDVARLRYPPWLGGPTLSVSADGRWMLSTQLREEYDLMLIEDFR